MTVSQTALTSILDVSRETQSKLEAFEQLVRKWNPAINLVSKASLSSLWSRHIVDSVQLFPHFPENAIDCLDVGSGGGFPGIVLAAIAAELHPAKRFTLVESDQRKATFLREASRQLGLVVDVKSERIELLQPAAADVLSARALAPLSNLLQTAERHLAPGGVCLFPKGESHPKEIEDAQSLFNFDCKIIPSLTDPKGVILKIHGIQHA
jgi:16S rRNA (guanine527-N7)-methyltransferase